jgi:outer membrane immunogenic protein
MLFHAGRSFVNSLIVITCVSFPHAERAAAADVPYPVKGPVVAAVPPSWAGFYVGAQVGYGMDSVGWRNLGTSAFFSPIDSLTRDRGDGVVGGGQVGYNFQFNRIVFGLEGSISAADLDRSFASPYFPATDIWSSKITWLSTVTGRIGYGFDTWLPYIKGGLAVANIDTSIQNTSVGAFSQSSAVHSGWALGGGVEFKIAPKFSLGLEFMHTDLGRSNDLNGASTIGTPENYGGAARSNSFMARLNYYFFGR